MSHEGWCVWVTGFPGSGKSTITHALLKKLAEHSIRAQVISSDTLRRVITPSPKYTEDERDIVYGAIVFTAKLLTENGVNVIIDATGNRSRYRDRARKEIPKFVEAFIKCPLDVCIKRETDRKGGVYNAPKDIYGKALAGKSATVPGMGVPYEEPKDPEVAVESDKMTPEECAEKILATIIARFYASSLPTSGG